MVREYCVTAFAGWNPTAVATVAIADLHVLTRLAEDGVVAAVRDELCEAADDVGLAVAPLLTDRGHEGAVASAAAIDPKGTADRPGG